MVGHDLDAKSGTGMILVCDEGFWDGVGSVHLVVAIVRCRGTVVAIGVGRRGVCVGGRGIRVGVGVASIEDRSLVSCSFFALVRENSENCEDSEQ